MSMFMPPCTPHQRKRLTQYVQAALDRDYALADQIEKLLGAETRELETRLRDKRSRLQAALWYAQELTQPVFPIVAGAKRPLIVGGFKQATCEPAQIKTWWGRWQDANIGLPTGIKFDVIDLDQYPSTQVAPHLPCLNDASQVLGVVQTPRGYHIYTPPTGEGNAVNVLPHVDYRGKGGYVLAPPSIVGGYLYQWLSTPTRF